MSRPLLNFLSYDLTRLHVDPELSFEPQKPQRAQIQATFSLGRSPEEVQMFDVNFSVRIYKDGPDENLPYTIELEMVGRFSSNAWLTMKGVPALVTNNALSMLYGAARGIVGQATGGGIFSQRFVLPAITFDELVAKAAGDPGSNVITDQEYREIVNRKNATPNEESHREK